MAAVSEHPNEPEFVGSPAVATGIDVVARHNSLWAAAGSNSNSKDELPARPASCAARACRIAVVTNQTGVDARGRRTVDVLAHLPGIELRAVFSPEHGIHGALDTTEIGDARDGATGAPVYSVYGASDASRRPAPERLRGLDAVVFDLQDAGVRWYTYETTLGYFLEACAAARLPLIVLDRPNPLSGALVQGAVSDEGSESFVNYHAVPIRHGLTLGELARLFNGERRIGAALAVVRMHGWRRQQWFDQTGLPWVNPSPNLRSLPAAILYPGVALLEGTNVSVGRGTAEPFTVLGAPWIDAGRLAAYLTARRIPGVSLQAASFEPAVGPFAGQRCQGVRFSLARREQLDSPQLGLELASALLKLYPGQFKPGKIAAMLVNERDFRALLAGEDPRRIAAGWPPELREFERRRQKYLLY